MLFFIKGEPPKAGGASGHSNTSHVILYLTYFCTAVTCKKFKYISCYSLSNAAISGLNRISVFKYISCYSLS